VRSWPTWALFLAAVLLGAGLRLPKLAARPMHADEAIHADKLGTLLEGGGYAYDPAEYHGPALYYLSLASAWLRGARRYADLDEVALRVVPAGLGLLLVAAHLAARSALGTWGAAAAALLAALSPAMAYYSRDYIHETALVAFTFGLLLAGWHYARRPGTTRAVLAGTCAGLMLATKETAVLALGSMAVALLATTLAGGGRLAGLRQGVRRRDLLLAVLAALTVASLLFSSFLRRPEGLLDGARTFGLYAERAHVHSWHVHPWDYYLRLLVHFPAEGAPFWSEGLILALAAVGATTAWIARDHSGASGGALRFLSVYTLVLLALYCAIPYKTPWCVLGFLHGMILLAGAGAVSLLRGGPSWRRAGMGVLLLAALAQLGWQAFAASFRFAADPRNPYVYAQTGTDVFTITDRLEQLARSHPAGRAMPVQVVSRENVWPLPWYLRRFSGAQWWTGVSDAASVAPVVLLTPDMEPALVRRLYDLRPPGERELYVGIFDRPVELRPRVEIRGYAARSLAEQAR